MRGRFATRRAGAALVGGLGLAGLAGLLVRRRQVGHRIQRTFDGLETGGRGLEAPVGDPDERQDLPEPIQRYLDRACAPAPRLLRTVRLRQRGAFRLGGTEGAWRPVRARQIVSLRPPGFAWDATIDMGPGLSARVLDAYVDGEGRLRANLLGALPVASAGPDRRMNEAELLRYLAEAVWYPRALLPSAGVEWRAIDTEAAEARLRDGAVSVRAVFHVEGDRITRVTADRYRQETGGMVPWVGRFRDYQECGGRWLPTAASVGWSPAGEVVPYWRGRLTEIEYA